MTLRAFELCKKSSLKTGSWPAPFVEASIHSLFCFEPEAVDSVFGTPQGIRLGLEQLSACLSLSQDETAAQTLRYTLAMLQLEKRFAKRDDLLSIVHARLKHAAYSADNFSNNINTINSNIFLFSKVSIFFVFWNLLK